MYDVVYYEEDRPQDNRRSYAEKEKWNVPEEHYDDAPPRQGRHIARIQISNQDMENRNIGESEQHSKEQATEQRSVNAVKRNPASHKNAQVTVTCNPRNIPPAPPAPSEVAMRANVPKAPPVTVANNGRGEAKSDGRRDPERSMAVRQEKALSHGSSTEGKRATQAMDKPGRMIVVNMGRSPQASRGARPTMGSNGKHQTNPFLNGVAEKRPHFEASPPQQINNVQEVVQRMNSGDWPIKIDDERCSVRSNQDVRVDRAQMGQRQQEKAHNWETLQRNKPAKEQCEPLDNIERRTSSSLSRSREKKVEKCSVDDDKRMQRLSEEDGYRSDNSEPCEQHTSVSTDSAFASEDYPRDHQPATLPNVSKSNAGALKHMEIEARKLLLYFKSHRVLLNYLGIGLTESLWHHISALPIRDVQISVIEDTRPSPGSTNPEMNNFITAPSKTLPSCAPTKRSKPRREERSAPAQSPRLVALERQLRTDVLDNDWDDESRGCFSDGEGERRDGKKVESRGGRFVKKSAAALIAKKQGYASSNEVEEPNSSEIVDPRIASEIRALREREEELRRSRTELGLPTLDDVMSKYNDRSLPMQGGLRSAHSYDQLHQLANGMYCMSQSERFSQATREKENFSRSSATQSSHKDYSKKSNRAQHDSYVKRPENSGKPRNKHSRQESYSNHSDL
ncbi:hypothetical protein Y032_0008g83 [Ancylostoma ceylanicum]|nr:hypothetical protein Y032_0008g83 [Ancylostoma ceylanicum]